MAIEGEESITFSVRNAEEIREEMEKRLATVLVRGTCEMAPAGSKLAMGRRSRRPSIMLDRMEVRESLQESSLQQGGVDVGQGGDVTKATFSALLQPGGEPVKILYTERGLCMVDGRDSRKVISAFSYSDIEMWEEDTECELFGFAAPRGQSDKYKVVNLVTMDGPHMREMLMIHLHTTEWHGKVSGRTSYMVDGGEFKVMRLPLGTQASVEFKASCLVITDRTQIKIKGGVAVREITYDSITSWHVDAGLWGFESLSGLNFKFATDLVMEMRVELEKRVLTTSLFGKTSPFPSLPTFGRSRRTSKASSIGQEPNPMLTLTLTLT